MATVVEAVEARDATARQAADGECGVGQEGSDPILTARPGRDGGQPFHKDTLSTLGVATAKTAGIHLHHGSPQRDVVTPRPDDRPSSSSASVTSAPADPITAALYASG